MSVDMNTTTTSLIDNIKADFAADAGGFHDGVMSGTDNRVALVSSEEDYEEFIVVFEVVGAEPEAIFGYNWKDVGDGVPVPYGLREFKKTVITIYESV